MRPELFSLPFVHIGIKSYGLMLVLGFIAGLLLARRSCRKLGESPEDITNFGLYALLAGVGGARLCHVIHNWSAYRDNLREIFAIWSGGLEFLGGFIAALAVMLIYFRRKKLPILKFLDILAPALMLGLAFGRMGCFLNGCCFGGTCDLPWAIRFPAVNHITHRGSGCEKQTLSQYSFPFDYQLMPDFDRKRGPLLELPADYYDGYVDQDGYWVSNFDHINPDLRDKFYRLVKPAGQLSEQQLKDLEAGIYKMHPIHPTQLYSLLNALLLCVILTLLFRWRKRHGQIFAYMLIGYGITRFGLECIRTEPTALFGLTISQILGLLAVPAGVIMLIFLSRRPPIRS